MGLTYRGVSLQETDDPKTSRFWFDIVEGVPGHESPQVRGPDTVVPGRQGRTVRPRVNDVQELLIEGWIRGEGADQESRALDWHALSQTILAAFALDSDPGTLEVSPGAATVPYLGLLGTASIEARTLDQMAGPIESRMSFQTWSFRLECVDGLWWSEEESS